jgi:hypothetical protein
MYYIAIYHVANGKYLTFSIMFLTLGSGDLVTHGP